MLGHEERRREYDRSIGLAGFAVEESDQQSKHGHSATNDWSTENRDAILFFSSQQEIKKKRNEQLNSKAHQELSKEEQNAAEMMQYFEYKYFRKGGKLKEGLRFKEKYFEGKNERMHEKEKVLQIRD